MSTGRAALILAATALAGATVGALAVLALRPDIALLLAAGTWYGTAWLWRRRYGIALTAAALLLWHRYRNRNGDPR